MPETRLLAVAGLGLDRPWPELGPERGAQRREQARAALVQLADVARRGADALLVAGGLLDRRSAEPTTVDLLARLFEAIGVPVLLVPGALDWYSEDSPLATTDWPPNVHVVTDPSGEPFELPTGLVLWGCAITSPLQPQLSVPGPGADS
jgi:exonuclease SbcD